MITSRQRLLDFLQTRETASAGEIARALHFSPANARHHLSVLAAEGVVQVVGERPRTRPGRPVQLYALALPAARHNLDRLADAALEALLARTPPELRTALFNELVQQMAGALPATRSLTLRLSFAIQRLNEMGYRARWEAHAAGPHLILGHCPYAAILERHPSLCSLDEALLGTLLGARARLIARLEPGLSGLPHCVFQVE